MVEGRGGWGRDGAVAADRGMWQGDPWARASCGSIRSTRAGHWRSPVGRRRGCGHQLWEARAPCVRADQPSVRRLLPTTAGPPFVSIAEKTVSPRSVLRMKPRGSSTGLWLPVTFLLSVSCSCAQARVPFPAGQPSPRCLSSVDSPRCGRREDGRVSRLKPVWLGTALRVTVALDFEHLKLRDPHNPTV